MTRGRRLRLQVARRLVSMAERLDEELHYLPINFPPVPRPRYGFDRPRHRALVELFDRHRDTFRHTLESIAAYADDLARIARAPGAPGEPFWDNPWVPGLDAAALYGFVRSRNPARYVEIGSGNTTKFVARAIRDGGLRTKIVSIDPAPRAEVDALCDEVIRSRAEDVGPELFGGLTDEDLLFVDNSHRALMNSDVVAFFLDVLPGLPAGLLVGIHDVLLPDDYFPEWSEYHFSEQYMLAAWLLGGASRMQPTLGTRYASTDDELSAVMAPVWSRPELVGIDGRGWAFWFEVG